MYYNKRILEAIKQGVNLALDDFDFNDEQNNKSKQPIIDNENIILDKLTLTVDLGLPSGTRWCIYNLGVDPKHLDTNEDWIGNFYQWAVPEVKQFYNSDNYPFDLHPNYDRTHMNPQASKYKNKHKEKYSKITGFWKILDRHKAGYIEMDFEDDAAYISKGVPSKSDNFQYCIPSRRQFIELWHNCSERNEYNYKGIKGLEGKVFRSKINGNEIFFPFAGYKSYMNGSTWMYGYYWTSTLDIEEFNCSYSFDIQPCKNKEEKVKINSWVPYNGLSIRPVLLQNEKRLSK